MLGTKPIAVGINDWGASQEALLWAAHRAAHFKLPLVVLHVVDDRWIAEAYPYRGMIREMGEELLQTAVDRAKEAELSLDVSAEFLEGNVGAALGKYSSKASMLVVGAGGAHLGGSLTDRALQVAAVAKCPVAVIGNGADGGDRADTGNQADTVNQELEGRQGIVVGVDGSEEATQAVAFAAEEAGG